MKRREFIGSALGGKWVELLKEIAPRTVRVALLLNPATGPGAQAQAVNGQPAPGVKQSVPDLDAQVACQRAFEATLWAMPAVPSR